MFDTTEPQTEEDKEKCAIALDEAFGMCGNNDVIFTQIAKMMGIRDDALRLVSPLKEKYRNIMASGITSADSKDIITRWVIARAWDLTVNEKSMIMEAFDQAWEEADVRTGKIPSAEVPEPGAGSEPDPMEDFPDGS